LRPKLLARAGRHSPWQMLSREEQLEWFAELWLLSVWLIPRLGIARAPAGWRRSAERRCRRGLNIQPGLLPPNGTGGVSRFIASPSARVLERHSPAGSLWIQAPLGNLPPPITAADRSRKISSLRAPGFFSLRRCRRSASRRSPVRTGRPHRGSRNPLGAYSGPDTSQRVGMRSTQSRRGAGSVSRRQPATRWASGCAVRPGPARGAATIGIVSAAARLGLAATT